MAEIETTEEARDTLAGVVLERFRRAVQYRDTYIVHQGVSYTTMLERSMMQYRREYMPSDLAGFQDGFGRTPTRYLGIVQQKTNATVAWYNDLVVNNLDSMFTVTPSPNPDLDKASLDRIRRGVKRDLTAKMLAGGIADPELLLNPKGQVDERIQDYLIEQVRATHKVEQARIISLASESAKVIQTRMRDVMIEGQFRQAYGSYTHQRALLGNGIIKFPDWQRRAVLRHSGKRAKMEWEVLPWFRHIRTQDFYPVCDAVDYQTNSGNTERTSVSKAELISMASQDDDSYFAEEITDILEEYVTRNRNWLDPISSTGDDARETDWNLDETIPLLIHEGFFSGDELSEYGITGIDSLDYVSAKIVVCANRTIQAKLLRMPGGADRSYFGAPFTKVGDNLLDCIGLGAMLWDSEQRANTVMMLWEDNIDWASRPPKMVNPSVFENPGDANSIVPGGQYNVEDRYATSGTMPEPIRNMSPVSAQYHLIMSQLGLILRQADEDCGIPAFAYSGQDYGRASLGEFSQRMSNALRTIKQAALNEDIGFIEPGFRGLFNDLLVREPELAEGQDVGCMIRGMTGLLKQDEQDKRQAGVMQFVMQGGQQGIVPEAAVKYAVRNLLEQAGFPVDALGLSDPVIDSALAVAAAQPTTGMTAGGPQVPQLDGRSGVPAANVASPSGQSQLAVPGVQV